MKPISIAHDNSHDPQQGEAPGGEASPLASTVLDYCRELQRRVQPKAAVRDTSFFDLLDLADRTPVDPARR
jgi:hypothetical protein